MLSISYTEEDGHFIAGHEGSRWLLDTGSPISVGNGQINLNGTAHQLTPDFMGVDIDSLRELAGISFDALLGMDVMGSGDLFINQNDKQITFGTGRTDNLNSSGTTLPFETAMGIPMVTLNIGGKDQKLFFDTGAKVTYLPADAFNGYHPIRTVDDFYPGIGPFCSPVYELPADIGGNFSVIEVAELPDALHMLLSVSGASGILGNSAWSGRSLYLDFTAGQLKLDAVL